MYGDSDFNGKLANYKVCETSIKHALLFISLITAYNTVDSSDVDFERIREKTLLSVLNEEIFFLPSGRVGNELALLLELHEYAGALLLIENNDDLGFDLDFISKDSYFDIDGYSLKEEFVLSLLTYDDSKINNLLNELERKYELKNYNAIDKIRKYIENYENIKYR